MNIKIFKKKTNNNNKQNKVNYFSMNMTDNFECLKVIDIINYHKFNAILYNTLHNVFYKRVIYIKDIFIFDDKLSIQNRNTLKLLLEDLLKDKYYRFKITNNSSDYPEAIIYRDMEARVSVNTILANNLINCLVLKDKIREQSTKLKIEEGHTFKNRKKATLHELISE